MSQPDEAFVTIVRGITALEGKVLEQRGEALLPGADASIVPDLDRASALFSQLKAEFAALRSRMKWRAEHSGRSARR